MILILASILLTALISWLLLWYSEKGYEGMNTFCGVFGVFIGVLAAIGAIIYSSAIFGWIAADHKAQIINREFGTKYTQAEVFFASDVIDEVRQLDRKRYEINGDIARDEETR